MAQYSAWKSALDTRLEGFCQWSEKHKLVTADALSYLHRARTLLGGDQFTIACVGEFSRGKTELINALLFSDTTKRLLPSQPGRTTMCPTEIFWDPQQPKNCVRLLPIETRRSSASMQSFKRIPQNWFTIGFDPNNHDSVVEAIGQVSASKMVTRKEAARLGFNATELEIDEQTGQVQIPTWRHALINFDHPLLREGLRIVDTPGLNALGNEPELTLKTLPDAQAILFLLAADSGVSASDMTIWRDHIAGLREDNCTAVLALLNKIDTLWDELTPPAEIAENIEHVRLQTAKHLGLAPEHVLPISAKKALTAKVRQRRADLLQSNFPQLEQRLAECILRSQQQIISHRLVSNSHDMIVNTYNSLTRRIDDSENELQALMQTSDTGLDQELDRQREKIRTAHHRYHKQSLSLKTSQRMLNNQRTSLLAPVEENKLQRLSEEAQERMNQSWTTMGLSQAIGDFFDDVDASINHLIREVERANKVLSSIYDRPEHGLDALAMANNHKLNITSHRRRLRNLENNADRLRRSLNSVLATKSTLINRFLATLVKEVNSLFSDLRNDINNWLQDALTPLTHHNQHQKKLLEHHMMRLGELRSQTHGRKDQLQSLEQALQVLSTARGDLEPLFLEVTRTPEARPVEQAQVVSLQQARAQAQN
ncbi:dynamin family protein [Gilvimarinus sp. SDUM040013]|uniref:Dynamin family protein n=2 Tax=Gilvimarinus gilvus TaxID=3058038 RepID=A0ABU4S151_9GAMM|nr:dynamin family protein [Gilvimarinus sp. SDUM040013]MDO3387599.1 dynamin family protein [Gilvimarinus sp. SDUM040013]MDX6850136.1 dynamin family protein [Gilvimarinus sp. SDUM040013]